MENIGENQASTQSTLPAQDTPQQQPPMTPQMQAAMAELAQMQNNPEALQANAEKYGMGQEWKDLTAKMQSMAQRNQQLVEQDAKLKQQFDELTARAKSSSTKMMITNIVGLVLGAGGIYAAIRGKADWGKFKKSAATIGGGLGGGLITGFIASKIFGSGIEKEYNNLAMQGQQTAVALEQIPMMMKQEQEPVIMALVNKMAAAKQADSPSKEPSSVGIPPITAPSSQSTDTADVDPSSQSIKLSDGSISPAPVQVGSQNIAPRGSSAVGALAKEPVAGVGAAR